MCLLVVCDAHSTPTKEELLQGACRNPDGFGFAIMADGGIISERTMDADKSIDRFLELRAQYPEAYALWHCRIATHGLKNEGNCHPFAVGGDTQTYLAHNGMLSLPMDVDDDRSDTRYFAEEVLPAMGGVSALDDPAIYHILEKWATGSKVVVLTVDPSAKFNLYILNEKAGEWDNDGVWWSNTYHRPAPPKNYYATGGWGKYDDYYGSRKWDYSANKYVPIEDKVVVLAPKALTSAWSDIEMGNGDIYSLYSEDLTDEYQCSWCSGLLSLMNITDEGGCPNCDLCVDCGDAAGFCLCYQPPIKDYSDSHQGKHDQPTTKK